jgi:aspartate ammonia-lyase
VTAGTRTERDELGDVEVPADALFGAQTVRAVDNFTISGVTLAAEPELLDALLRVKIAAARANVEAEVLSPEIGASIVQAAREILAGEWRDQFPIDIVQGGGGTPTHMNVNEVLANRANQILGGDVGTYDRINPHDHVNRSQSTNDVYPTALQIAVLGGSESTLAGFHHLARMLERKADEFDELEHLGRTCLRDALPVSVSAMHRRDAHAIDRTSSVLGDALEPLRAIPLGGTVVGTGAGAPLAYRERVVELLAEETAQPLRATDDVYDAFAHLDPLLGVASAAKRMTMVTAQMAQDLRFLSSGPVGGIGEISLPPVQSGSSFIPGKVNPVIPELVLQISFEARGAYHTIEAAIAAGELELNVMEPVIARHLLAMLRDAGRVARILADRCIAKLTWNEDAVAANLRGSNAAIVASAADGGWWATMRSLT